MKRSLLRGQVRQGMFPDERVVVFSDHQGRKFSTIVQDSAVAGVHDDSGLVEVRVIDEKGDVALVMLPGEILGASRTITVRNEDLQVNSRNGHY